MVQFVDVIHTANGPFGLAGSIGHVDFYVSWILIKQFYDHLYIDIFHAAANAERVEFFFLVFIFQPNGGGPTQPQCLLPTDPKRDLEGFPGLWIFMLVGILSVTKNWLLVRRSCRCLAFTSTKLIIYRFVFLRHGLGLLYPFRHGEWFESMRSQIVHQFQAGQPVWKAS